MTYNINILIPAAGKGTRSNLSFPKTLFKINNKTIIQRILDNTNFLNSRPTLVIAPSGKEIISNYLSRNKLNCDLIIQKKQLGMGNAILQFEKSKLFKKSKNILLIWGDIPFIKKSTFRKLVEFHLKNDNTFTILSMFTSNPYTYIKRNQSGKIIELIETKELKKKYKYGERDVGVFIFNKDIIFKYLKKNLQNQFSTHKEHNFLYLIKYLARLKYKVESLPIASTREAKSLNYINDLL